MKFGSIVGCGWLGLPLANFLIQKGFQISATTTTHEKIQLLKQHNITPCHWQLGEPFIENFANFWQSSYFICTIPPLADNALWLNGLRTLAQQLQPHQRLIFTSATSVYGDAVGVLTEQTSLAPTRPTSIACAQAEQLLRAELGNRLTILRLAGLVGGSRQAGRFLAGKTNVPDGNQPVNLVHLDDCIQVIYQIILQEKWGFVFNVCADAHPSRRDFYPAQAQRLGLVPPTFAADSNADLRLISNDLLKKELGYSFLHPNPMDFPI